MRAWKEESGISHIVYVVKFSSVRSEAQAVRVISINLLYAHNS